MPQLTVTANQPAGTGLRLLTFDGGVPDHTAPGQYVVVSPPDHKPGFFAIASSPGENIELLVKVEGVTATHIAALEPGASLPVSEAKGKGFPLATIAGKPLVVMCNGSGVSAVRSVVRAEVAAGLPRSVHLYYGVLTPDRRSFLAELEDWANAGVTVRTVVGEPDDSHWTGATGFVQEVAAADGVVRSDVGVVLCGVPAMLEQARAAFVAAGCPNEHVLLNY